MKAARPLPRPRLAWIRARARQLMRLPDATRHEAVQAAADDWRHLHRRPRLRLVGRDC